MASNNKYKQRYTPYLAYSLAIFLVFILWIIGSDLKQSNLLIPSIKDTFIATKTLFSDKHTYYALINLLKSVSIGLIIGVFLGVMSGILAYHFNFFYHFSKGFIVFFRTVPRISVILVIIIVFGYKLTGYVSFLLIMIPIAFDTIMTGLNQICSEHFDVFYLEGKGFLKTLRFIYLPFIKDHLSLVIIQGIGLGIKVMIMSDYLVLTKNTIGANLFWARSNLEYNYVFAWTVIVIMVSICFDLLLRLYKRKTAH